MFVFVAIVQCILSSSTSSTGNVIYVDQSAAGPLHDGSSWCSAFVDLQDALAISIAGDDIHVANGSYLPDQGTGDRAASFQLIDGVGLYGGYAGCGAIDPNARDVTLYESVLSGDLIGDDVLYTDELNCTNAGGVWYGVLCSRIGNYFENAYHVVVSTDNNETAILDGFTVSDGNANAPGQGATPASRDQGSGINIYYGNPTLRNCIFENNRAGNHGAVNDHGGATLINCEIRRNFSNRWGAGLHNHANIQTSASDCLFYANATAGTAGGGGGMFVKGQPTLINCIFSDNVSATNGGALYNDAGAVPTLINCTFTENSASLGGALYNTDGGSPIMTNCSITDNTATENGGGMYSILESHGVFTDCTFRANTAQSGGAIYLRLDSDPTLEGCTIIDNQATGVGFSDGGGGVYSIFGASPTLIDCTLSENSATQGGALYNRSDSHPILTNCSITDNTATEFGGGMYYIDGSHGVLTDCTFRANVADEGGALYLRFRSSPTLEGCTIMENHAIGLDVGSGFLGGGGIWMQTGNSPLINRTDFLNNTATVGGGAVYSSFTTAAGPGGGPIYSNCRFVGNAAGHGGAIATYRDNISFTNCEFSGNTAYGTTWRGGGGAIHSYQDGGVDNLVGVTLLHCTFSNNSSDDDGGGAIFLYYPFSIFEITGSIFWDNTHFGGVIEEEAQIYEKFGPADVTLHHTLLQGWTGIFGGIGNIGDDPLFVDASGGDGIVGTADDDLRIRSGSPCIDAGDNSALPVGVTTDLDGNPRIVNGIVDLGAYEFQLACGNGDCEADESPCTCSEDCGDPPSSEDPGSSCADGVDNDCDALTDCEDPDCVTSCPVPTVSAWGVCCMMLLLLTAGSLVLREREHGGRIPIR